MDSSEPVEDIGDALPPQPKNDVSFEPLGDLGCDF